MLYNQPYGMSDPNAPYINGNPATGTAGSIPPAASIEFPQREIVNLITDAGLVAPSNGDLHQLAKSVQSQLLQSKDDAGFANQLQVTMQPAPTAYFKYMQVICAIAHDNTGPTTLNCNAMGPKPIQHFDATDLQAGELKHGSIACFEFDGVKFQIAWTTAGTGVPAPGQPGTSPGPTYLTANADWYVNNATGSDTLYDGTSPTIVSGTIHGPFKTIQHACYQVTYYNLNGYNVTIHVADGTYAGFAAGHINGSGEVTIVGNVNSPWNVVVVGNNGSAAVFSSTGGPYLFHGFYLQVNGGNFDDANACINCVGNTTELGIGAMVFGPCTGTHISISLGATVWNENPPCPWTIDYPATGWSAFYNGCFMMVFDGGQFVSSAYGGPALTIERGMNFPGSGFMFVTGFANTELIWSSVTNPSFVSGRRYYVSALSMCSSGGGGPYYYPGSIAGVADGSTGGYYT